MYLILPAILCEVLLLASHRHRRYIDLSAQRHTAHSLETTKLEFEPVQSDNQRPALKCFGKTPMLVQELSIQDVLILSVLLQRNI